MTTPLYDDFSADYDRFVNWERRLAFELPFIERQLKAVGARRVLDAACGTGQHAIELAKRGYEVVGADLSEGMITQARRNVSAEGVMVSFVQAGFGHLASAIDGTFDAVLCLGNSVPHLLTADELAATLRDWVSLLRPDGLLLVQSRNADRILALRERWMPPQAHQADGREWLFVRFYDFHDDGTLTFHVLRLRRDAGESWEQQVTSTRLRLWRHAELVTEMEGAGYKGVRCFGNMAGAAWEADSPDLVVAATHPGIE